MPYKTIMRLATLFTAALLSFAAIQPAVAKSPIPQYQSEEQDLVEHGSYINRDGQQVHKPSRSKSGKTPQGASAKCRDGSFSFSTHHRGTCSRHGGVAMWLK